MGFTGVRTWQDVVSSGKEFKIGATRVGSTTGDLPLILADATPAKLKLVDGYDGTSEIRRAMQGGEIDAACWGWESMVVTGKAMLEAEGNEKLIPVLVQGPADDPLLKDAVSITSILKDPDDLSAFRAWMGPYEFQRPIALPPGTSPEVLQAWRDAFDQTMKDAEFLNDTKQAKLYLNPVSGEQIDKIVAEVWSISPKAKQSLQFLMVGG
jgi:hypothetical protein